MFFGRTNELRALEKLHQKKTANFVVVQGRRRIGKSTLIEEFAKNKRFYNFSGLPLTKETSLKSQIEAFLAQLRIFFPKEMLKFDSSFMDISWWNAFNFLADRVVQEPGAEIVILLDEISWMGSLDSDFLGVIKTIWDQKLKKNPNLILFLCGSVSSWIEKNIIGSTGFVGRISMNLTLKELPLYECNLFFKNTKGLSAYEKFKFLSVTGGVPKYLEEWQFAETAEENIKSLCFSPHGFLFHEFDQIFNDSFGLTDSNKISLMTYRQIVECLISGPCTRDELAGFLKHSPGGYLSECLENLITAGFVSRDFTWNIKEKKYGKLSAYRLSDNYSRFYLKYIFPHQASIKKNLFQETSLSALSGWAGIMGLQFENLVLNNTPSIFKQLNISPAEVEVCNPYFQKQTTKQKGCQIDLLIQTKTNVLYVCEVKFSRNLVGKAVSEEVAQKCANLNAPKGFSKFPVLICVNGVEDSVLDDHDFFRVIDFGDLLESLSE